MNFRTVVRTAGSAKSFRDEPLPDQVVYDILDDARFASSGGNRQGWRVILVKDPQIRLAIRDLYVDVFDEYVDSYIRGLVPFSPEWTPPERKPPHQPFDLADNLHEVPALLLVLTEMSTLAMTDCLLERPSVVAGASIYPFVQNILLSARSRDVGARLTTLLTRMEPAVAKLCAIPETHALAAMIIMGYHHRPFKRLNRRPVSSFATIDTFGGQALAVDESDHVAGDGPTAPDVSMRHSWRL